MTLNYDILTLIPEHLDLSDLKNYSEVSKDLNEISKPLLKRKLDEYIKTQLCKARYSFFSLKFKYVAKIIKTQFDTSIYDGLILNGDGPCRNFQIDIAYSLLSSREAFRDGMVACKYNEEVGALTRYFHAQLMRFDKIHEELNK